MRLTIERNVWLIALGNDGKIYIKNPHQETEQYEKLKSILMSWSSDYILERDRELNEVKWTEDADVCSTCGMRFDEVEYCPDPKCPSKNENIPLENKEE